MTNNKIFLDLFERIFKATDSMELMDLSMETHKVVSEQSVTDEKEIIILMLSLQVQSLIAHMDNSILGKMQAPIYIRLGDSDKDYEQIQLEEFYAKELENFRQGCIFAMDSLVLKIRK